jgi:two-component system, OmpR family, response regulator MtrA
MRLLVIDSDEERARERARHLQMDSHRTALGLTARAAALKLVELPEAIVLCDIGGPVETIEFLRALRAGEFPGSDSSVPILLVGADDDQDAIRYYRAGADHTLTATSSPPLIAAALEAIGRRAARPRPRVVRVGALMIDQDARTVAVDGRQLHLTRLEFDLVQTLTTRPHKAFGRDELIREVWGYDPGATGPSRTVDSTAHRLRKKLEDAGAPALMQSVRGVGWRIAGSTAAVPNVASDANDPAEKSR